MIISAQRSLSRNAPGSTGVPGGGIWTAVAIVSKNSIVANSVSTTNCEGSFAAGSTNNMATDGSCGASFTQKTSGEINLGPLANNGGPTQTMALQSPSAAIDAGDNPTCAAAPVNNLDQRGVARPIDGDVNGSVVCDIGAYEAPCPADADADAVCDAFDNCPNWPNPSQALPPWPVPANDPDCDGFTSAIETFVGTGPLIQCGTDNWPPDLAPATRDQVVNIRDAAEFRFVWNSTSGDGRYVKRKDLNADGSINILDVAQLRFFWNKTCTP